MNAGDVERAVVDSGCDVGSQKRVSLKMESMEERPSKFYACFTADDLLIRCQFPWHVHVQISLNRGNA